MYEKRVNTGLNVKILLGMGAVPRLGCMINLIASFDQIKKTTHMKKSLLSILSLIALSGFAQPVLTRTNFMPIGFKCDLGFTASTTPGSAGANQTWNYSGLSSTPGGTVSVVNPSSTGCFSVAPTSNWAQSVPTPATNYFLLSTSQLEVLAESIPSACSGGAAVTYTDSKIALKFPFTYNMSYSDPYAGSAGSGTVTVTYDAYGTLIVPSGTVTNVMRIKIDDGGSTSYQWISTGSPSYPVMFIQPSATLFFSNPSVGINEIEHAVKFNMYPNPANDKLSIEAPMSEKQEVFVYNVNGQLVLSKKISGIAEIDLGPVSEGVYNVTVKNEDGMSSKRLVVVK